MRPLLTPLTALNSQTYIVAAAAPYAVLRTIPAYLAVDGWVGPAALIGVLAFVWVVMLMVLAVRRRQLTVAWAAAELTVAVFGGWFVGVLTTTPARTAVDPSLTLAAILRPLLAVSVLAIPILAFPMAALLISAGRKLTSRAAV